MQYAGYFLCFLLLFMSCSPKAFRSLQSEEKKAIKYYGKRIDKSDGHYHILLMTNKGNMVVQLFNETPLHRDNFLKLTKSGFYDSLLFHRVINNFMIQGGDPNSKRAEPNTSLGSGSAPGTQRIPAEIKTDKGIYHQRGALAAARDNNPEKASSNCQFYIVQRMPWRPAQLDSHIVDRNLTLNAAQKQLYLSTGGTPHLDGNYTVFGQLLIGYEVLDSIAATPTLRSDRPKTDVRMRLFVLPKR